MNSETPAQVFYVDQMPSIARDYEIVERNSEEESAFQLNEVPKDDLSINDYIAALGMYMDEQVSLGILPTGYTRLPFLLADIVEHTPLSLLQQNILMGRLVTALYNADNEE